MFGVSRIVRAKRGGILLTTLIFAVVIATMLAGLGTLVISFYSRATTESEYASSINLADAGANYEFRKINENVSNADTGSPGTTVSLGSGTFTVYCTMADGVTAWDKSTVPFYVISTGTIATVSRSIKVNATSNTGSGGAVGVFAVVSGDTSIDNGTPTVNGSVSTDGKLDFTGDPTVTGTVTFYGSSAGFNPTPSNLSSYTTSYQTSAVTWPSTSAVALSLFPNSGATAPGGLTYLSTHNDNALSSPASDWTGNSLTVNGSGTFTFNGKAGGANYYVTSAVFNGTPNVIFNNTAGPITVWQGTTNGTLTLNGGVATVSMATNPSDAVRFYAATTNGVTLNGTGVLDAGIYNVTDGTATTTLNGTGTVDGSIVCDKFTFNGNTTVNAVSGYYSIPGTSIYQFNNSYSEVNGL